MVLFLFGFRSLLLVSLVVLFLFLINYLFFRGNLHYLSSFSNTSLLALTFVAFWSFSFVSLFKPHCIGNPNPHPQCSKTEQYDIEEIHHLSTLSNLNESCVFFGTIFDWSEVIRVFAFTLGFCLVTISMIPAAIMTGNITHQDNTNTIFSVTLRDKLCVVEFVFISINIYVYI